MIITAYTNNLQALTFTENTNDDSWSVLYLVNGSFDYISFKFIRRLLNLSTSYVCFLHDSLMMNKLQINLQKLLTIEYQQLNFC